MRESVCVSESVCGIESTCVCVCVCVALKATVWVSTGDVLLSLTNHLSVNLEGMKG